MPREYEEDRRYREWKDNPCDEMLEKLYRAIERRAMRMVVSRMHRVDGVLAADLATHAVLSTQNNYIPQEGCNFSTWLTELLLRQLCKHLRDDPRNDEVPLEEASGSSVLDSYDDIEALAAREKVCALLRKLKGLNRRILVGKLRDLSDVEIAKLVGLPYETVKKRWQRLQKYLAKTVPF